MGLVKSDLLYHLLCEQGLCEVQAVIHQTERMKRQKCFPGLSLLKQATETLIARVIQIELERGDSETAVSRLAAEIHHHEGAETFAGILTALGDAPLERSVTGAAAREGMLLAPETSDLRSQTTKSAVLSSLLRASSPGRRDTVQSLGQALTRAGSGKGTDDRPRVISDQRLLEAAMYVPAWTGVVADYLAWPGLVNAVDFLRVHTEGLTDARELPVGRKEHDDPTELFTLQEIHGGAFEAAWFHRVVAALGEERLYKLLEAAKCVMSGGAYSRVKLFTDAALNKIPLEVLYRDIAEKRRSDKLLCLGLTPLKTDVSQEQDTMQDASARYAFIEEFFRQSQSLGTKRYTREKKACVMTLKALAANAGFHDTTTFMQEIESKNKRKGNATLSSQ